MNSPSDQTFHRESDELCKNQIASSLVIGSGRMATHWAHYLSLLSQNTKIWSRKKNSRQELDELLSSSSLSVIYLAISDASISEFAKDCLSKANCPIIHFSGAVEIEGLISLHPLMSFGPELYSIEDYQNISLIVTEPQFSFASLKLPNAICRIPKEKKARYHAACVLGGNFSVLLWQKFFLELERLGISKKQAMPYAKQVNRNIENNPFSALTGPLKRKDQKTMDLNLFALEGDSFQKIYEDFQYAFEHDLEKYQTNAVKIEMGKE